MKRTLSRRRFLSKGALTGSALWVTGSFIKRCQGSPNDKLDIACVGIGGRGRANLNAVAGENIVALCDVDDKRAGDAYKRFPWAKKYYDFRVMLDEMGRRIDAVVISTPDHTHFHPAAMAMEAGKHCYLEKPMAHSPWEVRTLTDLAARKKVVTQLGVQRHAMSNMHRVVELVKSGAIGEVREVHAWIGGDRGMPPMPSDFPPVPPHLKWDLWLGPARYRRYSPAYCPYRWRFWWDFGTGETGNWGCHILDISFWALDLKYPVEVEASGPPVDAQRTPKSMHVVYKFPARGKLPPVTLHWYHTKKAPAALSKYGLPKWGNTLFVGSKGFLLCDFGKRKLYPEAKFKDYKPPEPFIPNSPGFHKEWILACKGLAKEPPTCHFGYSGPLTETVLLGNVAYRAGEGFKWDGVAFKAEAGLKVQGLLHPPFRKGWEITLK